MAMKILIANRSDKRRKAVAAKPKCPLRAAHAGGLTSMGMQHV
jgi:hypothetical protein